MRWPQARTLLLLTSVVFVSRLAIAQQRSFHLDLQSFHGTATANGLWTVEGTEIGAHLMPRVGAHFFYAHRPLTFEAFGVTSSAVEHRISGEVWASIGFFNRVELGLSLPVVMYQTGDDNPLTAPRDTAAFGDLRFVPKLRLFGDGLSGFSAAISAGFRIPTAGQDSLAGSGATVEPGVIAAYRYRPLSLHLNAGVRIQPRRELFNIVVDNQLWLGGGANWRLTSSLSALAELTIATQLTSPFGKSSQTPVQALFGGRFHIGDFSLSASAGPGVVSGYGTPTAVAMLSFAYDPGGVDTDRDGIHDRKDACPRQPEDRDGFGDEDGCPEDDNDRDGILDRADKCPNEAEDRDGFGDQDGCPEEDNDFDGILDTKDKCPSEAEDKDGFEDADGCPEPDNDKDGVSDKDDKCPNEAEDKDGFADEDGCPEPDNDLDGIADGNDKCPNEAEDKNNYEDGDGCPDDPDNDKFYGEKDRCPDEPETKNGYQDDDGCPDETVPKAMIKDDYIWTSEAIYFDSDSWDIKKRFMPLLQKVAQAILGNDKVKVIYIEGHADHRGREDYNQWLSFNRAKNVCRYLVKYHVPPTKCRALGWGLHRPSDTAATKEAMAKNRRVLFHIEFK